MGDDVVAGGGAGAWRADRGRGGQGAAPSREEQADAAAQEDVGSPVHSVVAFFFVLPLFLLLLGLWELSTAVSVSGAMYPSRVFLSRSFR